VSSAHDTAALSVQTEACRTLSAEVERLTVSQAALAVTLRDAQAERDAALAKLKLPCGSCHPCLNWADETWRREGRKPPTVQAWEDVMAERDAALAVLAKVRELCDSTITFNDAIRGLVGAALDAPAVPPALLYCKCGHDQKMWHPDPDACTLRGCPCTGFVALAPFSAPKEPTP
jgi:hypothetical protein